jgi:type I restriction enzyme R subunit
VPIGKAAGSALHAVIPRAEAADDRQAVETLDVFRRDVGCFVRAKDFLSQIVDCRDTDLEKRSLYFKHLALLIAEEARHDPIDLAAVTMTHYHLRDLGRRTLELREPAADYEPLRPLTGLGSGIPRDPPQALLSEIVGR